MLWAVICRPTSTQLSFYRCLSYCCILVVLSLHVLCCHFTYFLETEIFGHLYCGQTAGWMKLVLGIEVGLSAGDFVLDRDAAPYPKRGRAPPNFRPTSIVAKRLYIDATWYGGRARPTRHCVRCGPSYPQKKGHTYPTQFLAHVYCGQMAGWINMSLGTEVDLGPGHIVLDGVPAPAKGAQQPPSFRPMSIVATVAQSQLLLSSC